MVRVVSLFNSCFDKPLSHVLTHSNIPSDTTLQQYQTTVKSLAEDPAEKGPDEFFGTVDQFLARMAEARADVAAMRRREEEERRKKEVAAAAQAAQAEKNVSWELWWCVIYVHHWYIASF